MNMRRVALVLFIVGAIAVAYGGVAMVRWRDRPVQANAATTDAILRLREEEIQRSLNEGMAKMRAEAAPWLWSGVAAIAVSLLILKITAKHEAPPTDLFQH